MATGVRFSDSDSHANVGDGIQNGVEGQEVKGTTQAVPVVQSHDWEALAMSAVATLDSTPVESKDPE